MRKAFAFKSLSVSFALRASTPLVRRQCARSMTCKAISDAETVQGLLRWVDRCNDVGTTALQPFVLAGQRVGAIPKDYGKLLLQHSAFQVSGQAGSHCGCGPAPLQALCKA